jgi:hypothetical protein
MYVTAVKVFDKLRFQRFSICKVDDADRGAFSSCHLRGAVASCSGHHLEAALIQWPNQQGREDAVP